MRVFVLLLCLILPAFAQQRQAQIYDLGPDVYNNISQANGYQWRAWGWIYPRGTYSTQITAFSLPGRIIRKQKDPCSYDETGAVGYWSAEGWRGNAADHSAQYRVTIYGQGTWFFRGDVKTLGDDGQPFVGLFDLASFKNGQLAQDDPPSFAEYAPRSMQCFGGEVRLFFGGAN